MDTTAEKHLAQIRAELDAIKAAEQKTNEARAMVLRTARLFLLDLATKEDLAGAVRLADEALNAWARVGLENNEAA